MATYSSLFTSGLLAPHTPRRPRTGTLTSPAPSPMSLSIPSSPIKPDSDGENEHAGSDCDYGMRSPSKRASMPVTPRRRRSSLTTRAGPSSPIQSARNAVYASFVSSALKATSNLSIKRTRLRKPAPPPPASAPSGPLPPLPIPHSQPLSLTTSETTPRARSASLTVPTIIEPRPNSQRANSDWSGTRQYRSNSSGRLPFSPRALQTHAEDDDGGDVEMDFVPAPRWR